ncbi:MAG: DUF6263 family protein [Phycisphaerales bacterium JB060]
MRYSLTAILILAAMLGPAGVGSAMAQEEAPQAEAAPEAKPVIELLEPGEDPQVRRYELAEGNKSTLRVVTNFQMQMDMGGGFEGVQLPASEMFMTLHVRGVGDDGIASVEGVLERVGVVPEDGIDPFVADAYSEGLAPMRGVRIRYKLDPVGRTTEVVATSEDGSPIIDQQMRSTIEDTASSASVQLPEEAIGVGGRWRIIEDIEIGGVQMQRTSTHTLTAIEDGVFHVSSKIRVSTEARDIENVDLPPNTRMRMEANTLAGTSSSAFSLDSIEGSGDVKTEGVIRMTVIQDGATTNMAQRLSIHMKIEPYEGDLPPIDGGANEAPPF